MGKLFDAICKAVRENRFIGDRILSGLKIMKMERKEMRKRWVQRGQYAVEVEVEVVYPADDPSEPCLEPATVRWLDEIARKAEQGDIDYLRKAGRVFQAIPS